MVRVGKGREQQRLDGRLEPARQRDVSLKMRGLPSVSSALSEERRGRRPPGTKAPASGSKRSDQRLAAVVAQADEGVLAGHQDGVGIDGWSHGIVLTGRRHFDPRVVVAGAPGDVGVVAGAQRRDGLDVVGRREPRALERETTPRGISR